MFCLLTSVNWFHFCQWSVTYQWKAKILTFSKIYTVHVFLTVGKNLGKKISKKLALYSQRPVAHHIIDECQTKMDLFNVKQIGDFITDSVELVLFEVLSYICYRNNQ